MSRAFSLPRKREREAVGKQCASVSLQAANAAVDGAREVSHTDRLGSAAEIAHSASGHAP